MRTTPAVEANIGDMRQMSGCHAYWVFTLRNSQSPSQGLSFACTNGDIFLKPSLPTPGERVDVRTLRAMRIAVAAFARRCTG